MYDGVDIVTNNPIHSKGVEKFLNKHKIQYDNIVFEENKEKLGMYPCELFLYISYFSEHPRVWLSLGNAFQSKDDGHVSIRDIIPQCYLHPLVRT